MSANRPPRPEVLAFLQDIKQNPDDDTPRLILADWLEEHDDPRGEFLRVQCELARHLTKSNRQAALKARERELLTAFEREWLAPLQEGYSAAQSEATFHRGLVQLRLRADDFLGQPWAGPGAWDATEGPGWVERVGLWNLTQECLAALATAPVLARLTALCLRFSTEGHFPAADILARSPHCSNLVALELLDFGIDDTDLHRLTDSPYLLQLKRLGLIDNSVRGPAIPDLAKFTSLAALDLSRNQLGDAGVQALSKVAFGHLHTLALDYNRVGDRGARALAASPACARLGTLSLTGNVITNDGIASLVVSPVAANLRTLALSQNMIGAKGADALVKSPHLKRLAVLDLQGNVIPDAKKAALQERFGDAVRL
jgi:uncharacterized protein (TIGR02996 family)